MGRRVKRGNLLITKVTKNHNPHPASKNLRTLPHKELYRLYRLIRPNLMLTDVRKMRDRKVRVTGGNWR